VNVLVILVPCSLVLGLGALAGFVWTLKYKQYDDLEGDAARVLLEDDEMEPPAAKDDTPQPGR